MPLVYVDSIKYLGFTFSRNHKDDDDMLRQMRKCMLDLIEQLGYFVTAVQRY